MPRRPLIIAVIFAVLAGFAAYAGWALYHGSRTAPGLGMVLPVLPYLLAGSLTVGAVIVVFVWLAGYSERRGYDERAGSDRRR
jgi:hypothetical protein